MWIVCTLGCRVEDPALPEAYSSLTLNEDVTSRDSWGHTQTFNLLNNLQGTLHGTRYEKHPPSVCFLCIVLKVHFHVAQADPDELVLMNECVLEWVDSSVC